MARRGRPRWNGDALMCVAPATEVAATSFRPHSEGRAAKANMVAMFAVTNAKRQPHCHTAGNLRGGGLGAGCGGGGTLGLLGGLAFAGGEIALQEEVEIAAGDEVRREGEFL